jgi:hypothetical protein
MSKIVKVSNGDYSLQDQAGGNIILDTTGTAVGRASTGYGTVTVYGNLDVKGITTYVESTNTEISDNIIQLNFGQTGAGISSANNYQSGIEIERGSLSAAQFVFNEQVNFYNAKTTSEQTGSFVFKTVDGNLNALQLRTISTDTSSDLSFDLQGGNHALAIVNSQGINGVGGHDLLADALNYASLNLQGYHIPNIEWVYNYAFSTATPLTVPPTGLALVNEINYPLRGTPTYSSVIATGTSSANGNIQFSVNTGNVTATGGLLAYFSTATTGNDLTNATLTASAQGSLTVNNVRIYGNTITDINGSYNLTLTSQSGEVEVNAVLDLDDQTWNTPVYASGKTKFYSSSTIGPGRTGVYVTNSTVRTPDELISRNRAVLLSILL